MAATAQRKARSTKRSSAVTLGENKAKSRELGQRLRQMRLARGWRLSDLSERSTIAISTLSKVESGALALTYDRLILVANAFELGLSEFLSDAHPDRSKPNAQPLGRLSIERAGEAKSINTETYSYQYLCTRIRSKSMVPVRARVQARTLQEFGALSKHDGEEFVYVLSGKVRVVTELYSDETLSAGECLYLDSGMGHAFLLAGDENEETWILFVNTFDRLDQLLDPAA